MSNVISRDQARALGLTRYFTGEACAKGHLSDRYVSSRICCECGKINYKLWYQRHPETAAEKRAQDKQKNPDRYRLHYRLNREKRKAETRDWYDSNKERAWEAIQAWRERNPGKARAIQQAASHRRRARKASAGGSHTSADLEKIYKRQRGKCALCKCSFAKVGSELDHIVPLARGGDNSPANLQYLCRPCNRAKHAKDPIQFAQERGLLL